MRRLGAVLAVVAVSFATAAGVATAQAAIQTYASRLRNVLGRGAISSDRDGLRLDLDREQVEGYGIPLGRVLAGAQRHDSPLLAPTLDLLDRSSTASGPARSGRVTRPCPGGGANPLPALRVRRMGSPAGGGQAEMHDDDEA